MFTTDRLRLRGYKGSTDLDNLIALNGDPQVAPWVTTSWLQPIQESVAAERLKSGAESSVFFAVVETLGETPDYVGHVELGPLLAPKNRNVDFGISIMPKHWNKGYGREIIEFLLGHALEEMGLHRVSLQVFEGNDNAISLYKRCGFVEEGRQRKMVWMKGGWKDFIYMGILDEEWAARKKKERVKVSEVSAEHDSL